MIIIKTFIVGVARKVGEAHLVHTPRRKLSLSDHGGYSLAIIEPFALDIGLRL